MIARLIMKVGSYSITRDELGIYSLLDPIAREVASGPHLDAMEGAAALLSGVLPVPEVA